MGLDWGRGGSYQLGWVSCDLGRGFNDWVVPSDWGGCLVTGGGVLENIGMGFQ